MSKTALLISTPYAFRNQASGGWLRSLQLYELLAEAGFNVTHISASELGKHGSHDLICVVSFANASLLRRLRKRTDFLWYDSTDSWKLTRKSLFRLDPKLELIRFARDLLYSRRYKYSDLVTYCTLRDKMADHVKSSKMLCIPNKIRVFPVENDYGPRFVFVGPDDYEPNRKSIQFLIEIMQDPKLSMMKLHIYGNTVENSKFHNIVYHPWATDGELYGKSDIHLVPVKHGAGMKYKTLVPLSLNLRVISTIEGAVGIAGNPNLIVVKNLDEFFQAMLDEASNQDLMTEPLESNSRLIYQFDESVLLHNLLHAFGN